MIVTLTAVVGNQLAVCNLEVEKIEWIGTRADVPRPPIDAFPTGGVVEIQISREGGGCYLYRSPSGVESYSSSQLIRIVLKRMFKRREQ